MVAPGAAKRRVRSIFPDRVPGETTERTNCVYTYATGPDTACLNLKTDFARNRLNPITHEHLYGTEF